MIHENVVGAFEVIEALADTFMAHGQYGPYRENLVGVMDVVWWYTGLSPAKYDVEPLDNMRAWRIVKRG